MFTKQECRVRFKFMRDQLTTVEYARLNLLLLENFKQLSAILTHVRYLHTYLPIVKNKEPDSLLIVDYLKTEWPEINLVVPKSDLTSNLMTHHLLDSGQGLISNKWGIDEPIAGESIKEQLIDMVLLPLLAFDMEGARVGYGKGYYDKFLANCKPGVQKIGLSLFDPVDRIIDIESHDVPLDICVTPNKIWTFRS
ncbi:MAG TPA: 5-formyltetrahydrofolate cyclo-ligase [Pseudosphingobacterium sp.]|nr:5-formyltetrahydrofolate cyclo-ligase [Pseudosphingobacterium sp.]